MADSSDSLLARFADNGTGNITAADLRIFVETVYQEKLEASTVVDNLVTVNPDAPLSASQGKILQDTKANTQLGVTGTFTTVDGKTITVVDGMITAIV